MVVPDWIWITLAALAAYEVLEHLGLILFYAVLHRKKPSICGPQGMVGKTCVVRKWDRDCGKVQFNTELWNAVGKGNLSIGGKAVIHRVEGLTLVVEPINEEN